MIAVIFEVWLRPGQEARYLELAAELRGHLEQIDGFVSVERFRPVAGEGKLLSVSFWRDEEAVAAWREHPLHRSAQEKGMREMFADFRIRVAEVRRDYSLADRREAADLR